VDRALSTDRIPVFAGEETMSTPDDEQDTGDVVDPTAADPTPDEITDPDHPDYVLPFAGATAKEA
jgi:hypothetical protein